MQSAERGISFAPEQRPDLQPTLRYIVRYVLRETPPFMQQQQQPAEPTWALIKETTEILPPGGRRMWMRELHPHQLQQALHSEPVFRLCPAPVHRRSTSTAGADGHDTAAAVYRGAAGLERATRQAMEATEKAAALYNMECGVPEDVPHFPRRHPMRLAPRRLQPVV